ncbi:MAG: hypothetical protein HY207_04805 [Nitrospirae bacterium]|nr:hypothetical protein [Nitrospirota bacterium]
MKRLGIFIMTLGIVLNAGIGFTGSKRDAESSTLGVPSYPGWTVHRLDDKVDASGKMHVYQYQYYSDDPAQQIISFYEQHIGAKASYMAATSTHTVNAPDGAMIQITAPPDGVAQTDEAGASTGKTWKTLITIIRFKAP